MTLMVYNTFTRKKEPFEPLTPGVVRMYTCGLTVYDYAHIGHARTYSNWDVVKRYLQYKGYEVLHVQNFTDVGHLTDDADQGEDKIIKRARERKVHPMELADHYIEHYLRTMDALKIKRPNIMPRATGHIPEMIELTKKLMEKGYAYETSRGIYFDIQKFPSYGKMSGLKLDELKSDQRLEHDPEKHHPADFALWIKADKSHIMQWPSPWGWGYPGWHIECSAMSMKYLGETLDIHGGGMDHIALHHPNERAQSEAATGKQFVRYWIHSAFLTIDKEKMSKSTGKFVTAQEVIDKYGAEVTRFYLISAHYRTTMDFSEQAVEQAREGYLRLMGTMEAVESYIQAYNGPLKTDKEPSEEAKKFQQEFEEAMDDDFNTPRALAALYKFSSYLNTKLKEKTKELDQLRADYQLFLTLADVLAINPQPKGKVDPYIQLLLELRQQARKEKNWTLADAIRDHLQELGVKVEDHPWGTIYLLTKI